MRKLTHIDFALGPGGWVKTWWRRGGSERSAFIRFRPLKRGVGWEIAELRVNDPTPDSLREIPLHRIALSFNALRISEELRERLDEEPPSDLDAAFREHYKAHSRKRLKRPASRKLSDDFYREVAFTYREAVIRGLNPGETIAGDAGVPYSTAARWIAQARELKFLPPGERGKVTV